MRTGKAKRRCSKYLLCVTHCFPPGITQSLRLSPLGDYLALPPDSLHSCPAALHMGIRTSWRRNQPDSPFQTQHCCALLSFPLRQSHCSGLRASCSCSPLQAASFSFFLDNCFCCSQVLFLTVLRCYLIVLPG